MANPPRILWLVEHVAREFDVACAVRAWMEREHGLTLDIRNAYFDFEHTLAGEPPTVVVHPFFYYMEGAMGTEQHCRAWPGAVHVNLAWEELFYPANAVTKAPADDYTRKQVLHHAWGGFFKDFLTENGVPPEHVHINGNPALGLYQAPYCRAYPDRIELARRHGLDANQRWIFIPENYRWAFIKDTKLQRMANDATHLEQLRALREFCRHDLRELVQWCRAAGQGGDVALILRPRPAVPEQEMRRFVDEAGGGGSALHLIKDGSVREWVMASDAVVSSFSTTLIEASVAGKPAFRVEASPMPESLRVPWYDRVVMLSEAAAFDAVCAGGSALLDLGDQAPLHDWARADLLNRVDPIRGLAEWISGIAKAPGDWLRALNANHGGVAAKMNRVRVRRQAANLPVNPRTHEKDDFGPTDVAERSEHFLQVLSGASEGLTPPEHGV